MTKQEDAKETEREETSEEDEKRGGMSHSSNDDEEPDRKTKPKCSVCSSDDITIRHGYYECDEILQGMKDEWARMYREIKKGEANGDSGSSSEAWARRYREIERGEADGETGSSSEVSSESSGVTTSAADGECGSEERGGADRT